MDKSYFGPAKFLVRDFDSPELLIQVLHHAAKRYYSTHPGCFSSASTYADRVFVTYGQQACLRIEADNTVNFADIDFYTRQVQYKEHQWLTARAFLILCGASPSVNTGEEVLLLL